MDCIFWNKAIFFYEKRFSCRNQRFEIIKIIWIKYWLIFQAYVEKLSENLDMEYSKKGIIVQCVLPGFVCSNMSGIRRSTLLAPTAETFVKSAISLVGSTSKTPGYFPHSVFFSAINSIHHVAYSFSVWLVTRNMENVRRRALRKYKKQ